MTREKRTTPEGDFKRLSDGRIDGRSLRRTGRSQNMTIRVSEAFSDEVKLLAAKSAMTIGQLIEAAVRSWAQGAGARSGPTTGKIKGSRRYQARSDSPPGSFP